jgi:hypothetical protein
MMDSIINRIAVIGILILCLIFTPVAAYAQSGKETHIGVKHPSLIKLLKTDSTMTPPPDSAGTSRHDNFLRNSGYGGPGTYLSTRSNLFFGYEKYQLTRFDRMLEGAQMGAKAGLLLSAVGTTAGMWDEKDSWYLVGALSALGVLLREVTSDETPEWRIRLQWEPERSRRERLPYE